MKFTKLFLIAIIFFFVLSIRLSAQWTQLTDINGGYYVYALAINGNNLFASTYKGVFRSTDNGSSWINANNGATSIILTTLVANKGKLFGVSHDSGIYSWSDNNNSWSLLSPGGAYPFNKFTSLAVTDTSLYVTCGTGYAYLSTDNGQNWKIAHDLIYYYGFTAAPTAIAVKDANVFISFGNGDTYRSTDNCATWNLVNQSADSFLTFFIKDSNLFAGANCGYVSRSTNNGDSWTTVNNGLKIDSYYSTPTFASIDTNIFVGHQVYGVFRTTNNGNNWKAVNTKLGNTSVTALATDKSILFAGTDGGVFSSSDKGASWTERNNGFSLIDARVITSNGNNLFLGTYSNGIYRSTDLGVSWIKINNGLTTVNINALATIDSIIYAGTHEGYIYTSTNNGDNWVLKYSVSSQVNSFIKFGGYIFAGTGKGVFCSTNQGANWISSSAGLLNPFGYTANVNAFTTIDNNIFAGSDDGGMFVSTNNGANWNKINNGLLSKYGITASVSSLTNIGSTLFAATNDCVFVSTDMGANWTKTSNGISSSNSPSSIASIIASGSNLFAGAESGGSVYLSTNNGTNWTNISTGLTNSNVWAILVNGSNLFTGTSVGLFKRPLSEVTAVVKTSSALPSRFALNQNYPNPFNPATTISFSIPTETNVSLKIYDILGREISTLVNEKLPAGNYSRQWNAASAPSGVYFYRLQTGSFTETKKLSLLK
jgi:photosystem II stability/assembly factor-like uncharacterized protein